MANSKQKPVPEGVKRSPGKSKFSIPRKEAPPIDGSYLDRLFADYDKQTQELQGQGDAALIPPVESPVPPEAVEQPRPEIGEASAFTPTPAPGPVPFPRDESIAPQVAEPVAPAQPEAAPTASAPETAARTPKRRPAAAPSAAPSAAPDGDAELLDKWMR